MIITLDAEHRYRVDGIEKPGVTRVLDHCGLIPEFSKQDWAAQKGTAIHHGAALLFNGYKLKDLDIDERIVLYLASLERFIETTKFKALSIEKSSFVSLSGGFGFCGTWDVTGVFSVFERGEWTLDLNDDWTIDLKSGTAAKWHKLQTAAYRNMTGTKHRGALYLQADGSLAKLVEHKDPNDWKAFYSALKIYHGEKELEQDRKNLEAWMDNG